MSDNKTKKTQTPSRPNRTKVSFSVDELSRVDELCQRAGFKTRSAYIRARSLGYRPPHNALTRHQDEVLLLLHRIIRQITGATTNLNQIAKIANTTQAFSLDEFEAITQYVEHLRRQKKLMVVVASHIVDMSLSDEDFDT